MRLVFVNRFYWPEPPATAQLLTDLAESLAAAGWDVTVITGQPAGSAGAAVEKRKGVNICRVRSSHFGKASLFAHALDFVTFIAAALAALLRMLREGDTLVMLTDPPLCNVLAFPIARLKRARVINWVQDIYPEVAVLVSNRSFFHVFRPLRDCVWRRSEACVTISEDMAGLLEERGVAKARLHIVPNWAPVGVQPASSSAVGLRKHWDLEGKFVVAYFGNLGRVHDLDAVLQLAEAAQPAMEIVFVFVGSGAQKSRLELQVRERKLDNVRFYPAPPREQSSEILALGDVHLVTLRNGGERVVFPSKLYAIAAAGRPVLFIGPPHSEIARTVSEHALGLVGAPEETPSLAGQLLALRTDRMKLHAMGAAGVAFHRTHGSLALAVRRWQEVLAPPLRCSETAVPPAPTP